MHRIFLLSSLLLLTSAQISSQMGSEGKTLLLPVTPREQIEQVLLQQKKSSIWSEDYSASLTKAQENGKPLLLAFMGSGWCPWTDKIDKEILSDPDFINPLKDQLNFVWLNIPFNKNATAVQVQELKSIYGVKELPTLIVITPNQEEMFRIGYLPLTPAEFAARIEKMIADYEELSGKVDGQELSLLGAEELQPLYLKARELNCNRYTDSLMAMGLKKDQGTFFLLERYAELQESGDREERESIREKITERDPKNLSGSQLRLAILDFQVKSHNFKKKNQTKSAVKPLVQYLKKFGEKDKENTWKVEMMIAQYLFTKNEISEALTHANASYSSAPETQKPEIAETISYLETYKR
ncbi:MAG: thioredoxin family protein [Chlamydiales bacterium]|nr:thioredoxin family protein [Chlamydiales bacterium]